MTTFQARRLRVRRRRIGRALVFAAVLALFVGQEVFTRCVREPYPALSMPGFGYSAPSEGAIRVRRVTMEVQFADGDSDRRDPQELLRDMPVSHRSLVLERDFAPPDRRPTAPPAAASDSRQWLRNRLAAVYPGREVVRVGFLWYDDTYTGTGLPTLTAQRLRGDLWVRLADER
jgi:hypothetical protein